MSWHLVPGVIRGLPGNASPYPLVLRGAGADAGRVCYEWPGATEIAIPADSGCRWGPGFAVDGSSSVALFPQNGLRLAPDSGGWGDAARWWQGSGSTPLRLWLVGGSLGWVLSADENLPTGATPAEAWDAEADDGDGAWTGDEFWAASSLPSWGQAATFQPRGRIRATGSTRALAWKWPRWRKSGSIGTLPPDPDAMCGVYEAADGADTSVHPVVGRPKWTSAFGDHIRSVRKDVKTGPFTYAWGFSGMKWNGAAGKYVIGRYGSSDGWWEGNAPTPGQDATFAFVYATPDPIPEDWEPPSGEDETLAWSGYVMCDAIAPDAYLTEVARWV